MKTHYIALYERLKAGILSGAYPLGSRLPSKRVVAREAGVSVITVEHAFRLLCEEGYAESRERSGFFAAYRDADAEDRPIPKRWTKPPAINRHRVAEGFPWNAVARKLRTTVARYGERLLIKSPNNGTVELREAIAAYLQRSRALRVSPAQIVIGSGAEYLYGLLAQCFRGEAVAIEEPSYQKIRQVYEAHGIECEGLSLSANGIGTSVLKAAASHVLHVTPYRSFPTDVTADASKRREYVRWAEQRGGWLVEDDFGSEFSPARSGAETLFAIDGGRHVIYINTFSKTFAPSLRIGYLVLPKGFQKLFAERVGFYSCTVPVFDQLFLADFIDSGDFKRHVNRLRRRNVR